MEFCRFCAKHSPKMKNIFDDNQTKSPTIFEILKIFKDIKITKSDNFSKLVCHSCYQILITINNFHQKFIQAQNTLKLHQSKDIQNLNSQNHQRLILPDSNKAIWKCRNCKDVTFNSAQDFINHMENQHLSHIELKLNLCCICTEKFKTIRELEIHLKKSHLNSNTCYFCGTWFTNSPQVEKHIKKEHTNYDFLCKICDQSTNSRTELNNHFKKEHPQNTSKYFCSECDGNSKGFSSVSCLARHIKRNHSKEENYKQQDQSNFITSTANLDENEIFMDEEFLENEFLDEIFFQQSDSFQFTESWLDLDFMDNEIGNYDTKTLPVTTETTSNNIKKNSRIEESKISPQKQTPAVVRDTLKESFKCPKCNTEYCSLSALKLHLAHDHGEYILICKYCGCAFNNSEKLETHQSQHISETMIIYSKTQAQGEIIENSESKMKRSFKCKQCSREFLRERNFIIHICESLSSSLLTSKNIDESDIRKNPLQCILCGMNFKNHKDAYKHRKNVHNIDPIECIICDKQFKTKAGLEYHLKAHTGIKAFICPYCEKKFTTNGILNVHIRTVHSTLKNHECKLCDRKFPTLDHLKKHVTSVHQKERNYKCGTCGKGFAQKSHLTQHELIHTGEKRFYCDFCLKGFIKKSEKMKHVKKCNQSQPVK